MTQHPVLAMIDLNRPYFDRPIRRVLADGDQVCHLRVWLPVQLDNGGWVAAVTITGLDLPPISAMPGADPLDALLNALGFARDIMQNGEGRFLFGDRDLEMGGLPVFLDRGFHSDMLRDIEEQAITLADKAFENLHGLPARTS